MENTNQSFTQRFSIMFSDILGELYLQLAESGHDPETCDTELVLFYAAQVRKAERKFEQEQIRTPKVRSEDSDYTKQLKKSARFNRIEVDDEEVYQDLSSGSILDSIEYEEHLVIEQQLFDSPFVQQLLNGELNNIRPSYRENLVIKALKGIIPDDQLHERAKDIALAIPRVHSESPQPKVEAGSFDSQQGSLF